MMNFLDMKDDSLLLPVRFEVHFEIVSLDKNWMWKYLKYNLKEISDPKMILYGL